MHRITCPAICQYFVLYQTIANIYTSKAALMSGCFAIGSSPLHSPYRSFSCYAPYQSSSLSSLQQHSSLYMCPPPCLRTIYSSRRTSPSRTHFPLLLPLPTQPRWTHGTLAVLEASCRLCSCTHWCPSSCSTGSGVQGRARSGPHRRLAKA